MFSIWPLIEKGCLPLLLKDILVRREIEELYTDVFHHLENTGEPTNHAPLTTQSEEGSNGMWASVL